MSKANDKIDLGLDRMLKLMQQLLPTESGLVELPAIHIAGTNGKGSVSAMLEAGLLKSGLRVGRYNSPHLIDIWDCIRINGKPISKRRYEKARKKVQAVSDAEEINATPFEILTATAFYVFKEKDTEYMPLDCVIIECGMGGARDATNILNPMWVWAYVLTAVSLDHQSFLGNTVAEITREKLGIVPHSAYPNQHAKLILAPQPHPEARDEVLRCQSERNFDLIEAQYLDVPGQESKTFSLDPFIKPEPDVIDLPRVAKDNGLTNYATFVPFPGFHQRGNTAAALETLNQINMAQDRSVDRNRLPWFYTYDGQAAREGAASAVWPGRCSWVETPQGYILADGAHNAASAALLREHIDWLISIWSPQGTYGDRKVTFIIALSHSPPKTPESILEPLIRAGDRVVAVDFTPPDGMPWVKSVPPGDITKAITVPYAHPDDSGSTPTLQEAIDWAMAPEEKGIVVVCGSLYLVADLYRLYPESIGPDIAVNKD